MIKVLFICLGNICRSPMAEAVFRELVKREGLDDHFNIDSVGTDAYHAGEMAHSGTRRILAAHGIQCHSLSRRVTAADLAEADYIIAMDRHNLSDLRFMARRVSFGDRLHTLLSFAEDEHISDVPDPYYSGNFEEVYRLVKAGCRGLLAHIRHEHGIKAKE